MRKSVSSTILSAASNKEGPGAAGRGKGAILGCAAAAAFWKSDFRKGAVAAQRKLARLPLPDAPGPYLYQPSATSVVDTLMRIREERSAGTGRKLHAATHS